MIDPNEVRSNPRVLELQERLNHLWDDGNFWRSLNSIGEGRGFWERRKLAVQALEDRMVHHLRDLSYALPRSAWFDYMNLSGFDLAGPNSILSEAEFGTFENLWRWKIANGVDIDENLNRTIKSAGRKVDAYLTMNGVTPREISYQVKTFSEVNDPEYGRLGAIVIGREGKFIAKPSSLRIPTIAHEMIHCNSYGFVPFILDEGMTDLLTCDFVAEEIQRDGLASLETLEDFTEFYANGSQSTNFVDREYFGYAALVL